MNPRQLYRRLQFERALFKKTSLSPEAAQDCIHTCHFQSAPSFSRQNTLHPEYDLMIVIPVYNAESYLEECLDSVFAQQTRFRFCVVAVDDGSTDASGSILDRYAFHENLRIIHQENRGYSGARNRALETICGQYVMFVDSDDILPPNAVEALMQPALQHDTDLVAGGYTRFSEHQTIETVQYSGTVCQVPSHTIPGYTCMKVIRAGLLEKFQFPVGFLFEDTVLSRLLFPLCQSAYTVPEIVYRYRVHPNSISASHHSQARCIDTYWITKYCLEEAAHRGYPLDAVQYQQYLQQCWVNFARTRYLSEEIQESLFILTRALLAQYFPNQPPPSGRRFRMLHRAFRAGSYEAYLYVLRRWDVL